MKKVNIHSKALKHQSIFSVYQVNFNFTKNDGAQSNDLTHHIIEKGPAVAILIYDTELASLVLVKQLRTATMTSITEIVAGVMDPGETPEVAAKREILEEVGYNVKQLKPIFSFYTTPGIINEEIYFFYAEVDQSLKVNAGGGLSAEDEDLELVYIPKEKVLEWMQNEKELDAKTIIGLQYFLINHN